MKISLFYEFPLPRPWSDDDEHKLFQDGLDEVEAADKAGFSTVWLTEHHFLEEYCHSTAPEIFLPRRASAPRTFGSASASCTCRLRSITLHGSPSESPRST